MRKLLLAVLLSSCSYFAFSQHHLKGTNSVELFGGITDLGYFAGVGYARNLNPKLSYEAALGMEISTYDQADFRNYFLFTGVNYDVLELGNKFFLNLSAGAVLNMHIWPVEEIGEDGILREEDKQLFNYGGYIGIEPEYYITDKFIFYLLAQQLFLIQDEPGSLMWLAGGGFKYSF